MPKVPRSMRSTFPHGRALMSAGGRKFEHGVSFGGLMALATPPKADKWMGAGVGVGVGVTADGVEPDDRGGFVGWWAVVGVLLAALAASIWIRWVASGTEFDPAPVLGPDDIPTWNLVVLRV